MEVLILQAFVSLMLVAGSLLLFGFSWRQRDHEHADRLALLPAEQDDAVPARAPVADVPRTQEDTSTAEDLNGIRR
ncbi:MAG: cytochrome oxidase [Deltaproteobacteria bacterium]